MTTLPSFPIISCLPSILTKPRFSLSQTDDFWFGFGTHFIQPQPSMWPLNWNYSFEPSGVTSRRTAELSWLPGSLNGSIPNSSVVQGRRPAVPSSPIPKCHQARYWADSAQVFAGARFVVAMTMPSPKDGCAVLLPLFWLSYLFSAPSSTMS